MITAAEIAELRTLLYRYEHSKEAGPDELYEPTPNGVTIRANDRTYHACLYINAAGRAVPNLLAALEAKPTTTACEMCGYDRAAPTGPRFAFLIEREMPSLNDRIVNVGERKARARYRAERETWVWELRNQRLLWKIPIANEKRRVVMTRVFAGRCRARDIDNLIGGAKLVVDALVLEGLLMDDSPSAVDLHYKQERGAPAGVRFQIELLA